MRIVSINSVFYGSTGKIIKGISDINNCNGDEHLVFTGFCRHPLNSNAHSFIGSKFSKVLNILLSYLTGAELSFSYFSTKRLIRQIKEFKPDLIHLHNLHNNYINARVLFEYIKEEGIPVVWTLHDCWSFTGHCPHFIYEKCYKWQTGCSKCPKYKLYPPSLFDNSKKMWNYKREVFSSLDSAVIVTPSEWLASMAKLSFLNKYNIKVINNGIDLSVFKPSNSNFKERYAIKDKHIILGVSYIWSFQKGINDFIELSGMIPDDYVIVLIGTSDSVDETLPKKIVSIHRTQNQKQLAEVYTAADVFFNPTKEEVFGLVNIEALACGTPVVTYNVGGSPECVTKETGIVVYDNTVTSALDAIKKVVEEKKIDPIACISRAKEFDFYKKNAQYTKLYDELISQSL